MDNFLFFPIWNEEEASHTLSSFCTIQKKMNERITDKTMNSEVSLEGDPAKDFSF